MTREQRWIPCSERLPEPKETENLIAKYYLVQNEYGDMIVARWDGNGWEQMYQHEYLEDDVIAWMPLPEKYKAEMNDNFSESQQKIVNTLEAVNRAHWINNHNGTLSCSYCHTWVYKDNRYSYMHYCPYCGKKMDEDESNEEMEVELVTCKDCKHRPVDDSGSIVPPYDVENRRLDETCPCINKADWHYSYVPEDEFFCAYAEKKSVTPVHKKSK